MIWYRPPMPSLFLHVVFCYQTDAVHIRVKSNVVLGWRFVPKPSHCVCLCRYLTNIQELLRKFSRFGDFGYTDCVMLECTLCLKKVPTFELSVTLSNLNRFSKFLHVGKRMKFATKFIRHYPPHLRHVATLPWEINNSNFLQIFIRYGRKCKQIAF